MESRLNNMSRCWRRKTGSAPFAVQILASVLIGRPTTECFTSIIATAPAMCAPSFATSATERLGLSGKISTFLSR